MSRAVDVVRRVAPRAKPSYLAAFEHGDALLIAHGIATPDRLAHFLAQILHESGGLELEWENMSYRAERLLQVFGVGRHSAAITAGEAQALARKPKAIAERVYGLGNPRKAQALGNTQPGDGFRYRGGGLLQTTGRDNYRRMGQRCGVDFESRPDLVVSAEHALKPALGEWTEAKLNAFADCNDILSISRAINIGSARSTAIPNGMEDRLAWFAKVRPLIGRVEFAATAAESKDVSVQPPPPEEGTPEPGMADIIAGRILRFGDRGSDVQAVQRALARLGYDLQGTGNYGANTQAAVADFQARHALEVDGEVGPATATAIAAAPAPACPARTPQPDVTPAGLGPLPSLSPPLPPSAPPDPSAAPPALAARLGDRTLRIGDAGDLVRACQIALARLGYDLKGSGNYGANTQSAVLDFQRQHNLEVDGEIGPETARAIDAATAPTGQAEPPHDGAPMPAPPPLPPPAAPPSSSSDGSAAAPTLAALLGDRALQIGDEGDLVRAFQLALAKLGYDLKGTGTFGGATDTAVTHFQQAHGLEIDGELGPETAAAIDAAITRLPTRARPRFACHMSRPSKPVSPSGCSKG
jgi:peptidoglycan hydrolase-like protein with peptidoglycan-binding domain/predicted chitinase